MALCSGTLVTFKLESGVAESRMSWCKREVGQVFDEILNEIKSMSLEQLLTSNSDIHRNFGLIISDFIEDFIVKRDG